MHAHEWIVLHGRYLRSISAAALRRKLERPKGHCTWCGQKVPKGRVTWCSDECVDDFQIRCQPTVATRKVWERDRGICAICGVTAPWQADHIVPVVEGGGLCDLSNYRTLCRPCHKRETAALRKRLAGKAVSRGR